MKRVTREKGAGGGGEGLDVQAFSLRKRGVVAKGAGCMLIAFLSFLPSECEIV